MMVMRNLIKTRSFRLTFKNHLIPTDRSRSLSWFNRANQCRAKERMRTDISIMTMSLLRENKKKVKRRIKKNTKSLRIFLKNSSTMSHLRMSFLFLISSSSQPITILTIASTQSVIQVRSPRTRNVRSMETSSATIR